MDAKFQRGCVKVSISNFIALTLAFILIGMLAGWNVSYAEDSVPPAILATNPPGGAIAVSRALPMVSITFSEPMNTSGVDLSYEFPQISLSWSPDQKSLFLTRIDQSTLLDEGATYDFLLNGNSPHFRDLAGNPLPTTVLSFVTGADTDVPAVIGTAPEIGSTNVSPDLERVEITFSEPMNPCCTSFASNFPAYTVSWSQDHRTLYITRNDQQTPLIAGKNYIITLNPSGYPDFRDMAYAFLPQKIISFTIAGEPDPNAPKVAATNPADGETSVSRDLVTVSITFSEPMTPGISVSSNFPSYSTHWSSDQKTLYLTRKDIQNRLPAGMTYSFILNPSGTTSFRDLQNIPLPETKFSFTTLEDYDYELINVPAAPAKGFNWPYYLSIPKNLSTHSILLVEPNNTGNVSDDWNVHDAAALSLVRWRSDFAVKLDVPLLVPTFPRPVNPWVPGGIYTHALDRYSLLTDAVVSGGSIRRVDLQLIAMIRDAQEKLAARGLGLDSKVFMMGFSASGAFTSRFTLLHPELVRAAAPGSPGGWPLAPVSEWWNGTKLRYPVGIADVESLIGKSVDLMSVAQVPQYIYVGDQDTNDALDRRELPQEEVAVICANLNCAPAPYIANRWNISEEMYSAAGISNEFVVYPGIAHTISQEIFDDIFRFFNRNRPFQVEVDLEIKVNGLDGPVTLSPQDSLAISIKLNNKNSHDNADWWLVAVTGSEVYFYTFMGWAKTPQPVYRGPLFFLDWFDVLNMPVRDLPAGLYTIYFGIDSIMDGNLNIEHAQYDSVQVNVVK